MTEAGWLAATAPNPMLLFLSEKASERKLRLFAVAGLRSVWRLLTDPGCQSAVEIAERFADGQASVEEMSKASQPLWDIVNTQPEGPLRRMSGAAGEVARSPERFRVDLAAWGPASVCAKHIEQCSTLGHWEAWELIRDETLRNGTDLLREIVGNPFSPVIVDSAWLTSTVVLLARQMYESRDFTTMPILADALQDAGCDDVEVLDHCRQPGVHVRGCWLLDRLLGKE